MRRALISAVTLLAVISPAGISMANDTPAIPSGGDDTGGNDGEDRDDVPVTVNENGDVVALASTPGTTVNSGGSGQPSCSPRPATATVDDSNPDIPGHQRTNPTTGVIETWYVLCGGPPARYAWVATDIDTQIVIDGAIAQALARIPLPTPDVNPAPDVGSYVNLGLWLAVTPPPAIDITATATVPATALTPARSFSVTATVDLDTTRFDPGDGTGAISCDGHGTPIDRNSPAYDDVAAGPCGHTYLQSSPERSPYQLAITSTHTVTWTTSDGRSGTIPGVDRTSVVDYDVDELQTLGTG